MKQKLLKPDGTEIVDLDRVMGHSFYLGRENVLRDIFDTTNIKSIMVICLSNIYPLYPEDDVENWLVQRVSDYSAVENFETASSLLQQLTLARVDNKRTDEQEEKILELVLKVIYATEEKYSLRESFRKALDILAGVIERHPSLYSLCDDSVRVLLKRLFLNYQEGVEYGILTNIVVLVGSANDNYLLPCIKDFYQKEMEKSAKFQITPFSAAHNDEWYRLLAICSHVIANLEEDTEQ